MGNPPGKSIYIMLSNSYSLVNRAIGLYTRAPYNHASIALDANLNRMYSFGRRRPQFPLPGGFVQEKQHEGFYARFRKTRCAIFRLQVTEAEYQAIEAAIDEFVREQDKYDFSVLGFFGVAAGRPINRPYKYFCSQFVSTVLEKAGIRLVDKPPGLVTPPDFAACERLQLVYEGLLCDYPGGAALEAAATGRDSAST